MERLEYATLKLKNILYKNQWEEFSKNLTKEKCVLHRRPQDGIREIYKLCHKTKSFTVAHSSVLLVELLYSHITSAVPEVSKYVLIERDVNVLQFFKFQKLICKSSV